MNNYTKHIGIVTNYIDNKYSITVDNKTIHMPFEIMHKLSVFPPSVMDGDHLKIGAQITLAKKDERIFYPDRDTYGTTRQETRSYTDGSYLLKDAKPFKQDISFQEMVSKFNTLMTTLPETTRMEALNTLMSMELTEEQKQEKLACMVEFPLDLEDTATLEKKGSLFDLAKSPKTINHKSEKPWSPLLPCVTAAISRHANSWWESTARPTRPASSRMRSLRSILRLLPWTSSKTPYWFHSSSPTPMTIPC